jgi:hypothetical protein
MPLYQEKLTLVTQPNKHNRMKVKVTRPNTPPKPGDCYYVDAHGPCMIAQHVVGGYYGFVTLETGVLLVPTDVGELPTSVEGLVQLYDCRRINDPVTLTPD